ncbi:MAG TPA: NADH-ubiquinone oxidoreductase-F iron-sulfur binding region domain-containing protein [Planosporangium sp.]|jgi:NADH:ubiquinone oxidoreductase subunit F (NADH-binding)|nr:NADH-ubiquinone oxidoreductase-F iron-sulfur binding region domain-containing protein [Planosporangium sp.]
MIVGTEGILPVTEPAATLSDYLAVGGGEGLALARSHTPEWVIAAIKAAGLRGRGGAGFPTATKWTTVRSAACPTTYAVCNAAEGEPGTFKDRFIIRRNPYQVLEGLAIAAIAVGASRGLIVIKQRYEPEISALVAALQEMQDADLLGPIPIQLVLGPDEYLFGEEKAAIEVIEHAAPLPRIFPPYQVGPFAKRGSPNPTAMNNVETLAHVPQILRRGADWFRAAGTETSPGTMVFTISGDVRRPGLAELPLGIPLRLLVEFVGGGVTGRRVKAVIPGASGAMLTAEHLDTPLDFDSMLAVGSGLGSAGFAVYDDSACIVAATLVFSRFLAIESCAQCPACKQGTASITECLEKIERGAGSSRDMDTMMAKCATVTGGQRCALPTGEAALVRSAVEQFPGEFEAHLGRACPLPRDLPVPKFVDFDEEAGRFSYDERYQLKQPDWTFAAGPDEDRERSA